jgi:hypothetical protein
MKIFSKKTFQFDHPAGEQPAVVVQHQDFAVVPDWVYDSIMFKDALADGDITVIESKQDELAAETGNKSEAQLEKERKSTEAKAAVSAAEDSPNQEALDVANDLVADLPNGSQKTSLLKKIAVVEATLAEKPKE